MEPVIFAVSMFQIMYTMQIYQFIAFREKKYSQVAPLVNADLIFRSLKSKTMQWKQKKPKS